MTNPLGILSIMQWAREIPDVRARSGGGMLTLARAGCEYEVSFATHEAGFDRILRRLRHGLDILERGNVFLDRFYSPRTAWAWDREANPDLSGVLRLNVWLWGGQDLLGVIRQWLKEYQEQGDGAYVSGGAAVTLIPHGEGLGVHIVSGGQDALDSLEFIVYRLHQLLREHRGVSVLWQEEPLER